MKHLNASAGPEELTTGLASAGLLTAQNPKIRTS